MIKTTLKNDTRTLCNFTKAKQSFITIFNRDLFGNMINQEYFDVTGKVEASRICKDKNITKNNF